MTSFVWEIFVSAIGATSGILAVAFVIVTYRSAFTGRSGYEANRIVSKPSLWSSLCGDLRDGKAFRESRTNHGIALDLETDQLVPQQRLSTDAVDDVIGRSA